MHKSMLFFVLAIFIPVINAQEKLTLSIEEAIQTGLEKSPLMAVSELSVHAAEALVREASTALLPAFRLAGSYTRLSNVPEFSLDLPIPNFPGDGIDLFPNIVDHYNARVSVQQPLFTGFRLRENRNAARYYAEAERYGHQADRNELSFAITAAYWKAYRAQELERVVIASFDQLTEHLKNVENFYEEGFITRNEVLKVRVQLSNIQVRRIEVRNAVNIALLRLNNLIGLPLSTTIELISEPGVDFVPSPQLDDYILTAIFDNPEVGELVSKKHMGESLLNVARSGWYPNVYLAGNYHYQRPHQRYLPLKDEFYDSWDIGVTVSFDLWNWGAVSHRKSQARTQVRQTEYAIEQLRDEITVEVTQHYLEVATSRNRIDAARTALEQAEENYRITADLFRQEMVVNADVLDADVALLRASMTYVEALTDYEIAKASLEKAVGSLQK
jgi:outer membrane protein